MNQEILFEKLEKSHVDQADYQLNKTKQYNLGQAIYQFGEVPKGVFYIKDGAVKITRIGANGKEIIVRIAHAHDFVGYLSLLKSWSYLTSAIAIENAEVYFFPKDLFLTAIKTDHDIAHGVINLLCERSVDCISDLVDMASKNVEQRLCAALLILDKIESKKPQKSNLIRLMKKDISAMIGAVPETVSRQLAKLEKEGFIKIHEKGVEIISKHHLAKISNLGD